MYDGQKINQLRKSGQLDEALVLAREALAREPDNIWNKNAAGWVFYNLCKKALNDNDNQAALTYLTEFDALTIPADEEKIHTNFNRLRGQIKIQSETKPTNPHNLAKYYQQLADQFSDSGMSVGWEIYYGLKELGQTNQSVGQITLNILRVYAQLDIEKPSRLHSLILVQAVKLIDDDIKLLDFIKWWNVENLRSEDYERQTDNDHTYSSLAEKTATALAKGIKEKQSEEDASSILSFLEQLTSRYPDNIWMKYHYGKLLLLTGQITVARDWVIPVVRTQMNRAWIWNDLADFYPDDPDLELACLCRALQADQNDQFIGRIRLRLAVILANRKNYPAAKCEVVRVEQFYESNSPQNL